MMVTGGELGGAYREEDHGNLSEKADRRAQLIGAFRVEMEHLGFKFLNQTVESPKCIEGSLSSAPHPVGVWILRQLFIKNIPLLKIGQMNLEELPVQMTKKIAPLPLHASLVERGQNNQHLRTGGVHCHRIRAFHWDLFTVIKK